MRQISRTTLLATGLMLVAGAGFAQGGAPQTVIGGGAANAPAAQAQPATQAARPATAATPATPAVPPVTSDGATRTEAQAATPAVPATPDGRKAGKPLRQH